MFDFLNLNPEDAINILKQDHDKVKGLFDDFEKAENLREKKKIVAAAIKELKTHAAIEEEIFYAITRKEIDKKIMNEADEEHHVAKLLIAELEEMDGTEDHYDAKFKVLSENIRHHIKEEESDMFPKARELDLDYEIIGKQLLGRKKQLAQSGFPLLAEEEMVRALHNKGDSPAKNAKITKSVSAISKASKAPIQSKEKVKKVTAKKTLAKNATPVRNVVKLVKPLKTKNTKNILAKSTKPVSKAMAKKSTTAQKKYTAKTKKAIGRK